MTGHEADRPTQEVEPPAGPRIYAASLSDYNAGILHGVWLEAAQEVDDIQAGVEQMLAASPTTRRYGDVAEEWAIHDSENFAPFQPGEYMPLAELAEIGEGISSCGPAFAHYANLLDPGSRADELRLFDDRYRGHWESMTNYAEQMLDDLDVDLDGLIPEWLRPYVSLDVEAFGRDLQTEVSTSDGDGGIYVFEL